MHNMKILGECMQSDSEHQQNSQHFSVSPTLAE